jgi:hypothetical protein
MPPQQSVTVESGAAARTGAGGDVKKKRSLERYRFRCMLPTLDGGSHCSYVGIATTVESAEDAWYEHVAAVHGREWLRDPWAAWAAQAQQPGPEGA